MDLKPSTKRRLIVFVLIIVFMPMVIIKLTSNTNISGTKIVIAGIVIFAIIDIISDTWGDRKSIAEKAHEEMKKPESERLKSKRKQAKEEQKKAEAEMAKKMAKPSKPKKLDKK